VSTGPSLMRAQAFHIQAGISVDSSMAGAMQT